MLILYPKASKEFYHHIKFRNEQEVFYKKTLLKNFPRFTEKHLRWSPFFNKLQVFRPETLLKRDTNEGVFLKILRKAILKNICERFLQIIFSFMLV